MAWGGAASTYPLDPEIHDLVAVAHLAIELGEAGRTARSPLLEGERGSGLPGPHKGFLKAAEEAGVFIR